jgi:glycogen(starch) synthase
MKILMTTWEFPPYKVGGIASHVNDLSLALTKMGHEIHVLTYGDKPEDETLNGVHVHRIPSTFAPNTISWSMFLCHKMEKAALALHKENHFDVVHAHDWMMVPAGVGIKKVLRLPLVFTLHSTEQGRSGVHDAYTKMINDLEWYGTYEANQIVTVGRDFCDEVKRLFRPPDEKIHYVPNGVDIERFEDVKYFIDRTSVAADWEKIVLFVGRMSHQKGIDFLLWAAPKILQEHPEAKFVISGGGNQAPYQKLAADLGILHKFYFAGYTPEHLLPSLYASANATVAPSIYEPFGIVALESAAARTPVVGSYTGGLKDTIIHEYTGLHTFPAHVQSIADQVNRTLSDGNWSRWMGENGHSWVRTNFTWDKISRWTTGIYGKAMGLWD